MGSQNKVWETELRKSEDILVKVNMSEKFLIFQLIYYNDIELLNLFFNNIFMVLKGKSNNKNRAL